MIIRFDLFEQRDPHLRTALGLDGCAIRFNNSDEMMIVVDILTKLGLKIYNYDEIILRKNASDYKWFIPTSGDDFVRTSAEFPDAKHYLSFDEFVNKYSNKKFVKIENPEMDPYGEEDWGYTSEKIHDRR